jgi:two-component system response regulator MprA
VTSRTSYVLVVDDDADVREAIADVLRVEGLAVAVARDGREALERLTSTEEKPSLILLDLMMPRMSGWQLLEVLRDDRTLASIPVCVVSASGSKTPSGARALLHKPFELQTLLDLVAKHLA